MSRQNVELVKDLYRRLAEERRFPEELLDREVEWVNPPDAIEGGTRHGKEQFAFAVGSLDDAFEQMSVEVHDIIDAGDSEVVVLATFHVTGRGSGLERHQPQGHVWTVREGLGRRFRWFNDPNEALRAAGLEPPG